MKKISVTEINDLVSKFSDQSLPKAEWNHQAHLIIGVWHNINDDFDTALDLMRSKIKTYNISVGTLNTDDAGYHETLTIFWMVLIKSFLLKHRFLTVEAAVHLFLESEYASKKYPLKYYSNAVLFSKKARKNWINGDIKKVSLLSIHHELNNHYDLSNGQFERAFNDCTLPPNLFSHEAHLRLAWININLYGMEEGERKLQEQLKNFVAFVGAKDKYNTTLTVAAIRIVGHFIKKSNTDNFKDFILEFPQLKNNFKELIFSHYSFDIFNLKQAKIEFLEPDLIPFFDES